MIDASWIVIAILKAVVLPWVLMGMCLIPSFAYGRHVARHHMTYPTPVKSTK
jgi:hypothetical protein